MGLTSVEQLAVLATAGLPVALIVIWLLFRWRYLGAVRRTIHPSAPGASTPRTNGGAATAAEERVVLVWLDATSGSDDGADLATEARQWLSSLRAVLSACGATFVVIAAGVVWYGQASHFSTRTAGVLAYFSTLGGFIIVLVFTRPTWGRMAAIATLWLVGAVALLGGVASGRWSNVPSLMWSGLVFGSMPLPSVAFLTWRRLRPLLVALVPMVGVWLLLSGGLMGMIEVAGIPLDRAPSYLAVAIGLLNVAAGICVAAVLFRRGITRPTVLVLSAMALTGAAPVFGDVAPYWLVPAGIAVNALMALAAGWLCLRFLRLKAAGMLPDEILHFTLCWLVLSAWLPVLSNAPVWPPWFILPFFAYGATMLLLLRGHVGRTSASPKSLLLLRVFEPAPGRRRLIDLLENSWRWIGRVDLVVGVDFADRTLSPAALEHFILGRVHRQFVKDEQESADRVRALARGRAVDGRYPLNELHCLPRIWQDVVTRLARTDDIVLMDLRGLRASNAGALFELGVIIDRVAINRIVLVADRHTDDALLNDTAQRAWAGLAEDSPNAGCPGPGLAVLRCSGSRADDAAITRALFAAARSAGPASGPLELSDRLS